MNVLFWNAMIPELKEYFHLRGEGKFKYFHGASELIVLGDDVEMRWDRATLGNLEARLSGRIRRGKTKPQRPSDEIDSQEPSL